MEEELFKGEYRIKSIRLENWNYAEEGWYFVTICTEDRKLFFGKIEGGKMKLNKIGEIADIYLRSIPEHFPNARVDKYVIMPNHIHAIIVIDGSRDARSRVSTNTDNAFAAQFGPLQPSSLSAIIQSYKSSVKRWCNKNDYKYFAWQPGYYEHIIRGDEDYQNIWNYIEYNPDKWEWDKSNPNNLNK
ncbi:MAG TPA: transposase [Patescibacteria group bacterium]|nr:transposase [Patescibacteria group bacterium]